MFFFDLLFLIIFISYFNFRCNSEHECSILADSDIFGGDPCHGVPKYLEVYFGCFQGMFMFYVFFSFERTYLFLLSSLCYNGF